MENAVHSADTINHNIHVNHLAILYDNFEWWKYTVDYGFSSLSFFSKRCPGLNLLCDRKKTWGGKTLVRD